MTIAEIKEGTFQLLGYALISETNKIMENCGLAGYDTISYITHGSRCETTYKETDA